MNTNSTLSPTSNKRFEFVNRYNYQNLDAIGLALNGYDAPVIKDIFFTAEPSYSFARNTFIITLITYNNSVFNLLTFSIILTSNTFSKTLIDLQNICTLYDYTRFYASKDCSQ